MVKRNETKTAERVIGKKLNINHYKVEQENAWPMSHFNHDLPSLGVGLPIMALGLGRSCLKWLINTLLLYFVVINV